MGALPCAPMFDRCRTRPLTWLHVLVLALFALGLVLQPVLAAAGELHELAHDPSGQHSHALHGDDMAAELSAAGENGEGDSSTLHLLLHFAHCCGAAAAMLPVVESVSPMIRATRPAIDSAQRLAHARLPTPFKPPISV